NLLRKLISWHPPEEIILIGTAVLVGAGTGLGAVAFIWLLTQITRWSTWIQLTIGETLGLLVTMVGAGLLVGYIVSHWAAEAKGHGVPEVMEAVAMHGGRIRSRVAAIKVLTSSLTIGLG